MIRFQKLPVLTILATAAAATVFAQDGRQSPAEFRRMLDMGIKHRSASGSCTKHSRPRRTAANSRLRMINCQTGPGCGPSRAAVRFSVRDRAALCRS